uniref:Uncharacterized protein n=1 Tax=Panagrolaimus superbus TaxID=310955 RepID=A0A914XYL3_9BILA
MSSKSILLVARVYNVAIINALYHSQLIYDRRLYIQKAYNHFEEDPPDYFQSSEKIWAGCVHEVKSTFYSLGYAVQSHRAIAKIQNLSIVACDNAEFSLRHPGLLLKLKDGWTSAQECHRFRYGDNPFDIRDFPTKLEDAKYFIMNFDKLDKQMIQKAMIKLINRFEAKPLEDEKEEKERKLKLMKYGLCVQRTHIKERFFLNGKQQEQITHKIF